MSNSTSAVGALILVPVAIAFCAAFLALKTAGLFEHIYKFLHPYWEKIKISLSDSFVSKRRKVRKSNIRSSQTYGDSWCDLESIASRQDLYSRFIGQPPKKSLRGKLSSSTWDKDDVFGPEPPQIWHPSRSTRLAWSFTNPRSPSLSRFESSSVVRRSPVSQHQGTKMEQGDPLTLPAKAKVALSSGQIDR